MLSKPLFFCAQQRSGTTVLQHTLEEAGIVKNYGEVFHFNRSDEFSFFTFKEKYFANEKGIFRPSKNLLRRMFNEYMIFLSENAEGRPYFLVDVKYNSWHHFNPVWSTPMTEPTMLKFIKQSKYKVLHIKRVNVFKRYLSYRLAKKTKVFHVSNDVKAKKRAKVKNASIKIDLLNCRKHLHRSLLLQAHYDGFLEKYKHKKIISYELMFKNGKFSEELIKRLSKLLEMEVILDDPALRKVEKDYKRIVKNHEEVLEFFKESKFSKYIIDTFT